MGRQRFTSSLANVIEGHEGFRDAGIRYTVSGRRFPAGLPVLDALAAVYDYVDPGQVESVYGATEIPSPLYGGWLSTTSRNSVLTGTQADALERRGIGVVLTLTNHVFDERAYASSRPLLERFHRRGNGVICLNDRLAWRLRKDYPLFRIEASSIKRLDSWARITRALDLYDLVVVPSELNKSDEFLDGIREKERVLLFGNSICDHECPTHECYEEVSRRLRTGEAEHERVCFKWILHPNVAFDVRKLAGMGFSLFKLVPIYTEETALRIEELRGRTA